MPAIAAHHRLKALTSLRWAFDANLTLAREPMTEERFAALKLKRDRAVEEFIDEVLLAAQEAK